MNQRKEKPILLLLLICLYFLIGIFGLMSLFTEGSADYFSLLFLPITYGLLMNKVWAFIVAKLFIALQLVMIFLLFTVIMFNGNLFPSDTHMNIVFLGFKMSVAPWFGFFLFLSFIGFQAYAVFSNNTKSYISST